MEENLLKLDMLGHDDPTMIRMLEDMTGRDAKTIPLDDPETMAIFTTSKGLGFEDDPILGPVGSCGIPEFGTGFTRGMLQETQPKAFDTLIRLSGFSHGTDVWLGNARDLILSKTATVGQAIGCRDDIMLYLIQCGMPEKRSFKIMEAVRKGRGLPEGAEQEMIDAGVPAWYIGSCKKIKYLFPKAHAVAYVMMAFRIAWYKVHEPLAFYAAYFYRRSQKGNFDAALYDPGQGDSSVDTIKSIKANPDASAKERRPSDDSGGLSMNFTCGASPLPPCEPDRVPRDEIPHQGRPRLLPPFIAVGGLGETAAWDILAGREGQEFISIEEFCRRVSRRSRKTHIENLTRRRRLWTTSPTPAKSASSDSQPPQHSAPQRSALRPCGALHRRDAENQVCCTRLKAPLKGSCHGAAMTEGFLLQACTASSCGAPGQRISCVWVRRQERKRSATRLANKRESNSPILFLELIQRSRTHAARRELARRSRD